MKGLLFLGDSFTWGQGLYYYSQLPELQIITTENSTFDQSRLRLSHILYAHSHRIPRLVANHFETFEVVRPSNGGHDSLNIIFGNQILENHNLMFDGIPKIMYDDLSYMIYQTTNPAREPYDFTINGVEYSLPKQNIDEYFSGNGNDKAHIIEPLLEFIQKEYDGDVDLFYYKHYENLLGRIKQLMEKFESYSIKTFIYHWFPVYREIMKKDDFWNERVINFNYKNTAYDNFLEMMCANSELEIAKDVTIVPNNDGHLSMIGNKIVAQSIINKIKEYESARVYTV